MALDDNEQMVNMLNNFKGSVENKIRQAYNSGYADGFKQGVKEAFDEVYSTLEKLLRQQFEQTEPRIRCDTCRFEDYSSSKEPCNSCLVGGSNWQPKDEPQTKYKVTIPYGDDVPLKKIIELELKDEPQTEPKGETNENRR